MTLLRAEVETDSTATIEAIFQRGYPRLVAQLMLLTGNRADAEDVVQEAFLRTLRRHKALETLDDPEGWIRLVAFRVAYSNWRRVRRVVALRGADQSATTEDLSSVSVDVLTALSALPKDQRICVVLFYSADMPIAEIAKAVHVSEGTVKSRLHRARVRLAADLEVYADGVA